MDSEEEYHKPSIIQSQSMKFASNDAIYNWHEITDEFKQSCKDLNIGELVHIENFQLFEAMTAIELMDPKMDVGMMCNRKKKILNFEQSIEANKCKINDFTFEEKIGIIDETFACFVTWLEGYSLSQTVFTNLYLHNPSLIQDRLMRTFCFSILKIVDFMKQLLSNNADVLDDEVFQELYGVQDNILTSSKVSSLLKDLEEDLIKKTKSNDKYYHALLIRIKFTRAFYQYLLLINKLSTDNNLQSDDLNKKLELCDDQLNIWKCTIEFGIKPDLDEFEREQQQTINNNEYPTIMGFSQFVNQRSLPPTFPRYTKIKTRPETIDYLQKLINRFKRIQLTNNCSTFHELLLYCNKLSEDDEFYSCICSRSILNLMINYQPKFHIHDGNYNSICKDDIWNFVKPFFLNNKKFLTNTTTKEYLDFFLDSIYETLIKLLRICCFNRARQQEKLGNIIYDLSCHVRSSTKLDTYLNFEIKKIDMDMELTNYFSWYASYYLIRTMIQYLLIGFDLELYSEHEYYFIYWYLHDNLINWIVTLLVRARNLKLNYDNLEMNFNLKQQQQQNKTKNSSSSSNKKHLNNKSKQDQNQIEFYELLKYNGLQFLTGALFKLCNLLMKNQIINQPKIIADNHEILYYKRLAPFVRVDAPPYCGHQKFKEVCDKEYELIDNNLDDYLNQILDQLNEGYAYIVKIYCS